MRMFFSDRLLAAYISALILLLLSLSAPAFAADKAGGKKAKQLFVEATDLYNKGEYAQAVIKFNDAYDLTLENELLYNIAVCYEKMDQKEKAIEFYGRYLDGKKEEEKDDAESRQIKKKIAALKSGEEEEGGEEDEEEEEGEGGGGVHKLKMPEGEEGKEGGGIERGGWSHGLRFLVAGHISGPALYYQSPGWSGRIGYNYRFAKGKGSLIVEAGYGAIHEDYFKSRAYDVGVLAFIFDWEVFQAKKRVVQLFVGGTAEFNYLFRNRRAASRFYALAGPDLALEWNAWRKVGFLLSFDPLVGFYSEEKHWAVGFVLKAGVVWGLK